MAGEEMNTDPRIAQLIMCYFALYLVLGTAFFLLLAGWFYVRPRKALRLDDDGIDEAYQTTGFGCDCVQHEIKREAEV